MYLSEVSIEGYRLFNEIQTIHLNKGLNVLVGENGVGKSTIIDAIRLLLNEDEYSRSGIKVEDFYLSSNRMEYSKKISIKGKFSKLSEDKKVEYLTWLDNEYNATLNLEIISKKDGRNNFKKVIWGGESRSSIFEWEMLNEIQCVYLPALRDAEKKLNSTRGSRLARLLINLSQEEMKIKRETGDLMGIEEDVSRFNSQLAEKEEISRASELINNSLRTALGDVFAQDTKIQFNELSYERIVESLRVVFFPSIHLNEGAKYRNLFENSLGYNNLIYLATILAEFEGLKKNDSSPRILLIEELEAHLHPQIQIKVLKYLEKQARENNIQVIITTHSTTIASAAPIKDIISINSLNSGKIKITSLSKCRLENKSERFIDRWLDTSRSTLLFSKGIILVEGLAEAMLIPKLSEIYFKELKDKGMIVPSSLEEAGVSVINMNGIFFQYFMQIYSGYRPKMPIKGESETKDNYKQRVNEFIKKDYYNDDEFESTDYIPIRCVALTDNDPDKKEMPIKGDIEGKNKQLYLVDQLNNMTENCRVFKNKKTFEYDMALEDRKNAKYMIEIILDNLDTYRDIRTNMENYLTLIDEEKEIQENRMAYEILKQLDSLMGKGLFAQLLLEKIDENNEFVVPKYIRDSIDFVLDIPEDSDDSN